MEERVQVQIDHEKSDRFKSHVIFPLVAQELTKISVGRELRILHIGEGSGQIASSLKDLQIKESILVDVNPDILKIAKKTFKREKIKTKSICRSATKLLPIKKGSVDAVIAVFSLNQIENPEIFFDLASHYLAPHGRLIVVVPDEAYIAKLKEKEGKLDENVEGVLDRKATKFHFTEGNFDVGFYARPNTDYTEWLGTSGFLSPQSSRLLDPFDKTVTFTPKAVMMVSRKMPARLGETNDGLVETVLDEVYKAKLNAVIVNEEEDYAGLLVETFKERSAVTIPFPRSEELKQVIDISLSNKKQILVRHVVLRSSPDDREKHVFKIYHSAKRVAYYSIDISSHNIDTITIFGVK